MCDGKAAKKQRAANFSQRETDLLCGLTVKYATIIESKQTDAVMWKEKMDCWGKVTNEFNSNNSGPARTLSSLKMKYDTIKKDLRKKIADNKSQLYKTGGGPYTQVSLTPSEEMIYNIIFLSVDGLPARYDDDNNSNTNIQIEEDETNILEQSIIIDNEITDSTKQDSFIEETIFIEFDSQLADLSYDPPNKKPRTDKIEATFGDSMQIQQNSTQTPSSSHQNTWKPLKKPLSKELQTKRKKHLMSKIEAANNVNTLAEVKTNLVALQCEYYKQESESKRKENALRIETAQENLKAAKLDVEIKTLEKCIKEETLKKILNSTNIF